MGLTMKNQGTEGFQQCILKAPQTIDLSPPHVWIDPCQNYK